MAENVLAEIADRALAVEENAEKLSTLLASQGAKEAAQLFSQTADAAREVVKQVPAAPGKQPEEAGEGTPPAEEEAAAAAAAAPPEGGGGGRTPYEGPAKSLQGDVASKRRR